MNDDLDAPLWGVEAIGAEINRTPRQINHLCATKQIPADKIGGRWVTTRRRLRDHFNGFRREN